MCSHLKNLLMKKITISLKHEIETFSELINSFHKNIFYEIVKYAISLGKNLANCNIFILKIKTKDIASESDETQASAI